MPLCPIGPPTEASSNATVDSLINASTLNWDVKAIRSLLPQYENHIRKLALSTFNMTDSIVWLPEKSGIFSTRSGYALTKTASIPTSAGAFNWSRYIWNLKTLPKLKLFLWRLMNNALPVGEALRSRGISGSFACKNCGEPESILHVLLHCPVAQRIWDLTPAINKPDPNSITTVAQLLQTCHLLTSLPPTAVSAPLHPWILWYLWTSRNKLVFENIAYADQEVVDRAMKEARSWQNAQITTPTKPPSGRGSAPPHRSSSSATKCFTDASWIAGTGVAGLGWLFRSSSGSLVSQGSTNRIFISSALMAEALAVKTALIAASSSGLRKLECFSDSKSLVDLLSSNGSAVEIQGILHDIFLLSSSFDSISFSFIPRLQNMDVDRLAKAACNLPIVSTSG